MTLDEMPELLTVPQVAEVLRVSPGAVYAEARRYESSRGREGLPVVRIGRFLRIPKRMLREWMTWGPDEDGRPSRDAA